MKLKLIRVMLSCAILFSIAAPTVLANAPEKTFSDLDPSHPQYDTIMNLVAVGVVEGYEDGTVKPDQYITRAELLKIIIEGKNLMPYPETLEYNRCFLDVRILEWYVVHTCYAEAQDWVMGYPEGAFKPMNNINNLEVLAMIFKIYEMDMKDYYQKSFVVDPYLDVPLFEWYGPYVWYAKEHNLIDVTGDYYYPGKLITRGEAFEILEKTLNHLNEMSEPAEFTVDNFSFVHPYEYQRNEMHEMEEGFYVFVNEADDGLAFVEEKVFESFFLDEGMTIEDMFYGMGEGKNAGLTVEKGTIEHVGEYTEYRDEWGGMFIFKVVPERGTNDGYYIVAHYTDDLTRSEIVDMIYSIEVI